MTHVRPSTRPLLRALVAGAVLPLVVPSLVHAQKGKSDPAAPILAALDAKFDHYAGIAKQIWGFAEVGYQEEKSSALLQKEL
ncbi:MAG TPA: hypothetical protein VFV33_01470, partial [Gemmatimonadaceae bacterium]|nr:hypothetical protein [Gemmatimonadaceae bacterium]